MTLLAAQQLLHGAATVSAPAAQHAVTLAMPRHSSGGPAPAGVPTDAGIAMLPEFKPAVLGLRQPASPSRAVSRHTSLRCVSSLAIIGACQVCTNPTCLQANTQTHVPLCSNRDTRQRCTSRQRATNLQRVRQFGCTSLACFNSTETGVTQGLTQSLEHSCCKLSAKN